MDESNFVLKQTSIELSHILEIENDSSFAEIVCPSTGILVWPAIRNIFLRLIISDLFYKSQPLYDIEKTKPLFQIGFKTLHSGSHNLLNRPKPRSVLIYASGEGLIERHGRTFNRYTGYFTDHLKGSTWSVEGVSRNKQILPRENKNLSYWYPDLVFTSLFSIFSVRSVHEKLASEIVNVAVERANELFGWTIKENPKNLLIKKCARKIASYPIKAFNYNRLFRRIRPILCIVESGCYGDMAVFNAVAKEHGVTVAEFQHGAVSGGHDAYNVSVSLTKSKAYQKTLPNFFMGYGKWWIKQFNSPINKIVIGNPHREVLTKEITKTKRSPLNVLILGDGVETDLYINFCKDLSSQLPDQYKVIFRPHPMEKNSLNTYSNSFLIGLEIDFSADIYDTLSNSYAVISEVSTASFEAAGISQKSLLWRTAKSQFAYPSSPLTGFYDISDLIQKLMDPDAGNMNQVAVEEIWASNWRDRFSSFIKTILDQNR
jgi:hypothetical protein